MSTVFSVQGAPTCGAHRVAGALSQRRAELAQPPRAGPDVRGDVQALEALHQLCHRALRARMCDAGTVQALQCLREPAAATLAQRSNRRSNSANRTEFTIAWKFLKFKQKYATFHTAPLR